MTKVGEWALESVGFVLQLIGASVGVGGAIYCFNASYYGYAFELMLAGSVSIYVGRTVQSWQAANKHSDSFWNQEATVVFHLLVTIPFLFILGLVILVALSDIFV